MVASRPRRKGSVPTERPAVSSDTGAAAESADGAEHARSRVVIGPLDDDEEALISACEGYAAEALQATDTPGLSIALVRRGRLMWRQAFGMADIAARQQMTVETTFPGGSLGKTYVAIAILQLVERGVLELHEPVRRYVPDLALRNPLGEREITVYDLLTYRSGLAMDLADQALKPEPLAGYIGRALSDPRRREYSMGAPRWVEKVGAAYHYSSLGMAILGHVVERTNPAGLCFADYVAAHISRPLTLRRSGFPRDGRPHSADLLASRCTGYARFGSVLFPTPELFPSATPANALITTPSDFALLLYALMNGGSLDGGQIVEPDTARMMMTPQVRVSGAPDAGENRDRTSVWNGIGLELTRSGPQIASVGHGGVQPWGWSTLAAAFPSHGTAVVASCNRWDMPRWYNPPLEMPPGLVVDLIQKWLGGDHTVVGRPRASESWPWRISWVIGFALAERTVGLLGATKGLDEPGIERLASEATTLEGVPPEIWDADGFRAGARAMLRIPATVTGIRNYLESGDAPVTSAELPLIALHLGHRGRLGLPQPFFATATSEAPQT
jgi:CubicO group peptidase (beta-lactamase class C family)